MILSEVAETEAVQMMLMRGVAERTVIGIVRRFYMHAPARTHKAMELFHGFDDIGDVFYDMDGAYRLEAMRRKWVGEVVQIGNHVGATCRIVIQPYRARIFVDSAANVKNQDGLNAADRNTCSSISETI